MLNGDALTQLSQLKKDIQASKDYGTGTVVGSNGRFGFVKLEDGRDAFLSPEKMQHLIPGDVVKVSITKNAKDKLEATLEKLVTPGLKRFIGQYRIKGNAHFVEPEGPQSSRWIFLPPKARGKCKDGDYVVAQLLNHPYKDTKASAKILERVGQNNEAKFEHKYIKAKYQLIRPEDKEIDEQVEIIEKLFVHEEFGERSDLSHIPFVTIDAATTKDMDDAIAIKTSDENGELSYELSVAIADPTSYINQGTPLAKAAHAMGQSTYLPGGAVPMLPTNISHHCFSLEADKKRPALVCTMAISSSGEIKESTFEFSVIESRHKLSYDDVSAFLQGSENSIDESAQDMLKVLDTFAKVRREYRKINNLVGQDQLDYDFTINDQGHIAAIQARPRTVAHQIVEEAMLATNISGAKLLRENNSGLFACHKGFRTERLGEVKALLKEEEIEHDSLDTLEGFVGLFHALEKNNKPLISAPLRRMTDNIELEQSPTSHLGMGLEGYATLTSPIRRYADLFNHWAIQGILRKKKFSPLNENRLEQLKENLGNSRQADRELYLWLVCQFASTKVGEKATGKVRIITQQGFGVKLNDTGIEGFILFPKDKEKKYDAKRMTLEVDGTLYHLDKDVEIKIKSVDMKKRRIAFEVDNQQSES